MKPCLFCAEQIQLAAIKCRYCGEMVNTDDMSQDRKRNLLSNPMLLRGLGIGLIFAGLATLLYFLNFYDTSIEVTNKHFYGGTELTRVNNLGLMQNRQNGIIVGGLLSLIGVICTLAAPKSTQPGTMNLLTLKHSISAGVDSIRKNIGIPDTRSNLDLLIYTVVTISIISGIIWAFRTFEQIGTGSHFSR